MPESIPDELVEKVARALYEVATESVERPLKEQCTIEAEAALTAANVPQLLAERERLRELLARSLQLAVTLRGEDLDGALADDIRNALSGEQEL